MNADQSDHIIEVKEPVMESTNSRSENRGKRKRKRMDDFFSEQIVAIKDETHLTEISTASQNTSRRRSSLSRRGSRLANLTKMVIPHKAVRPKEYYKHICMEMPEVQRMKTLLIWCFSHVLAKRPRHLIPKSRGSNEEPTEKKEPIEDLKGIESKAFDAFRKLAMEVVKSIDKGAVSVSWYERPALQIEQPIKPNPINQQNEAKLKHLRHAISRIKEELRQWQKINTERMNEHASCLDSTVLPLRLPAEKCLTAEEQDMIKSPIPEADINVRALTESFMVAARSLNRVMLARRTLQSNVAECDARLGQMMTSTFRMTPPEASLPILAALGSMSIQANT